MEQSQRPSIREEGPRPTSCWRRAAGTEDARVAPPPPLAAGLLLNYYMHQSSSAQQLQPETVAHNLKASSKCFC